LGHNGRAGGRAIFIKKLLIWYIYEKAGVNIYV